MSPKLGLARTSALVLLPLGAFLVGPLLASRFPDILSSGLFESVLPTVLPLAAIAFVALTGYGRTRSVGRALLLTAAAVTVAVAGAVIYLLVIWASASGS